MKFRFTVLARLSGSFAILSISRPSQLLTGLRLTIIGALLGLSLGACSGGGDSSNSTAGASVTSPASTTTASTTAAVPFFGVAGHYVEGGIFSSVPLATQAATLADLGVQSYRQDLWIPNHIDTAAATIIPGLGSKVTILPMIEAYPWNDPSLNGKQPTEESAYAYAYSLAAYAATKLAGIPMVEFGNEYDLDSHNKPILSDGEKISDYDNSTFPIWRGSLRGYLDGWRSVDTRHVTKLIANATSGWVHFGFLDGLMTGTQPDGTTGHPKITPDVIQWHWYSDGGDFENAVAASGTYNVLARLKSSYNLPIVFTEIGINQDFTEAQAQAYITKTIPELVAAKATYNVIGFNWYELYDDTSGTFGLMTDGTNQKPRYATLKSMIAAHAAMVQ
ncbi:beta-glucosidase [Burkholderia sp. BCC1988]|uniref:beta-glucosidase n=1 Tax=Burkholderia sp. BCC1988 TaxID=2817443 RepID=UPI002AB10DD7|nr:beta-glucosidase [Burkholderia sp. BCC1988]